MRTAVHRAFWYAKVGLYMDLNSSGGSVSLFNDFLTNCLEGIVFDAGSGVNLTSTEQVTMTNSTLTDVASPLYMYNTPLNGTAIGCAFTTNGILANGSEVLPTKAYWLLTNCTLTSVTNLTNSTGAVYVTVEGSQISGSTNLFGSLVGASDVLLTGNFAGYTGISGPIQTVDFQNGNLLNSITPLYPENGRAIAIYSGKIYYTDNDGTGIHIENYGTYGSGGTNIYPEIPNPDTRSLEPSIQGLSFHSGDLYALTGYDVTNPEVWALTNLATTNWTLVTSIVQTNISGNLVPQDGCDGFAVLTNGNYLINDYDGGTQTKSPTYREYNHSSGTLVSGGLTVDLTNWSCACGVVCDTKNNSLYFAVFNLDGYGAVVQTSFTGSIITNCAASTSLYNCEGLTVPLP